MTAGEPDASFPQSPPRTLAARVGASLARLRKSPRNSRIMAGLCLPIVLLVGAYFLHAEGSGAGLLATSAITIAICALLSALTRRLLAPTILTGAMIAFIVSAASAKRALEKMVVHAYDLYFYFPSRALLASLWNGHRGFMIGVMTGAFVAGCALLLAWWIEAPRLRRRYPLGVALAAAIVAALATQARIERRHTQFFWDDLFVSSFYDSWSEALQALWRGQLLEAAAVSNRPPLVANAACRPATKPPNIILIHEESVFPPSIFPQVSYDHGLDPLFVSADGRLHHLRVETYGGASWLTEFSVMTGLSTRSFGGMRQFLQTYMVNRLGDTLPQTLQHCGYRNVLFYPMLKSFISSAPFFNSIGIKEIFDARDQAAPTAAERDRFYFGNALAEMQKHFATSDAPLFTFIETMATHWPYFVTAFPEENVPGGGPGTDPELHEFLRRLWLAKRDYDDLLGELAKRFPNERFLIVTYGDHHPVATRTLLGFPREAEAEDITLPDDSPGYQTYFAINGVNYKPPALPAIDPTDVAYLSSLMLYSAGLPLPESYAERLRLMKLCDGAYYDCAQRDEILGFHRRLIDAGLLRPR